MKAYIIVKENGELRKDYRGFVLLSTNKKKLRGFLLYGEKIVPCRVELNRPFIK